MIQNETNFSDDNFLKGNFFSSSEPSKGSKKKNIVRGTTVLKRMKDLSTHLLELISKKDEIISKQRNEIWKLKEEVKILKEKEKEKMQKIEFVDIVYNTKIMDRFKKDNRSLFQHITMKKEDSLSYLISNKEKLGLPRYKIKIFGFKGSLYVETSPNKFVDLKDFLNVIIRNYSNK